MQSISARVDSDGYAVLPDWLEPHWCERLIAGLDERGRQAPEDKRLMPHQPFLDLLVEPAILDLVTSVLGPDPLFHHANGKRITDGAGKPWHHDFDSVTPWDGDPASVMLHVMIYPAGLTPENGPLVLRPRTHRMRVPRHHPNALGYQVEADDVTLTAGPGTVVLVHSALWHMRPPSHVTEPRYYLNFSFIGNAPVTRPEREGYSDLLASMPDAVPDQRCRDRLTALCRGHRF
ncbi:phytanoyl-CoA dioxygenase family protein [Micromonospora sp. NPDC049240]|uniref:phytanoyl-CoA dioxygenase family protein n=1 Tax=Micromonospora sp. NPDC049240 TaxID=3155151 RepID=UPI0033C6D7AB